jgi:hypothetical protein
MSFPWGNFIVDDNADTNALYLVGMRYKTIPVGSGEPPRTKTEIDWDATAKASAVLMNVGEGKK